MAHSGVQGVTFISMILVHGPQLTLIALWSWLRGTWRTQEFKEYNFNALGIMPQGGHLHPLMKVCVFGCGNQPSDTIASSD